MFKKDGQLIKGVSILVIGLLIGVLFSPVPSYALSVTRDNVIDLTNQTRVEQGLDTLTEDNALTNAAQAKAEDMINRQYWAHFYQDEKPWDWMKKEGYQYIDAGENLAIDFTQAEDIHQAWLESASHRENIVNDKYQDIGIGISQGWFQDHSTIIVVQMFGSTNRENTISEVMPAPNLTDQVNGEYIQTDQKLGTFGKALVWIGNQVNYISTSVYNFGQSSVTMIGDYMTGNYSVNADQ